MSEPGSRRGRVHDAEGAREAILNAAETVFAEHGFDGARVDAIAAAAGYNKSLIFQYFGDKLNLYVEVIRRADRELGELQVQLLSPVLADETIAFNAHKFRTFLEITCKTLFDYLVAHPRFVRMMLWEQAEGWQTYAKIASQLNADDNVQLEALFRKARSAGLLRSDFEPLMQLTMILQICLSYLTFIPLYQMFILPGEDLFSAAALTKAREYIVTLVVSGMMVDPHETKP